MSWTKNLTTYHGGRPGSATLRKMETEAGGMEGIRRVDFTDIDGTHYILNTRAGMPTVIATKPPVSKQVEEARGFIAHIPGAAVAALFSPYALEVRNSKYTLFNHTYTVQSFASPYNVPDSDTTKWNDTVSFLAGQVLVNGKSMPALGVTGAPAESIPWLIPAGGGGLTSYGDGITKRVFAVANDAVKSWAGGGVEVSLGGSTYRAENKALLCGARIDGARAAAVLSQLVFTGASWDSLYSGWGQYIAEVSMSIVSPFLTATDDAFSVEGFTSSPVAVSNVPVFNEAAYVPKPAPVCASGTLYQAEKIINPSYGSTSIVKFIPALTDIYIRDAMESSYRVTSGTYAVYRGSTSQTTPAVVGTLTTTVNVEKTYSALAETVWVELSGDTPAETYTTQASKTEYVVARDNGTSPYFNTEPSPASAYGENNVFSDAFGASAQTYSANAEYTEATCSTSALVSATGFHSPLLRVEASIYEREGNEANLNPAVPTISPYDILPPAVWVSLLGEEWWAYATPAERQALNTEGGVQVDAVAAQILGKPLYSSGRLSAVGYVDSVVERRAYSADVSWDTRDFILFDSAEQIYIYVLGHYAGTQGAGNATSHLEVSLVLDVRGAVTTVALESYEFTQIELLSQEYMGLGTSLNYLPAPKIRPLLIPKYQEQGAFRGAAYTTTSEHAAGAVSAVLFNFVLELATYSSIGSYEGSESVTRFIPCNLIEMLYAYVFSTRYGVDSVRRYPVDYIPRFTNIMNTLFAKQYRINYRDGALVDWLDTLGADYATATTTEIYRI